MNGKPRSWPSRTMVLWHPESPGVKVTVRVLWPRYLFRPWFATLGEVLRTHKERQVAHPDTGEART